MLTLVGQEESCIRLRQSWVVNSFGWFVLFTHTFDVILWHLITQLDENTLSNNKWSGTIGNMLDTATKLEINPSFVRISLAEPLFHWVTVLWSERSLYKSGLWFQGYSGYKGWCTSNWSDIIRIGIVSHSRSLTANGICSIWVSKHGLKGNNLKT